MNAVHDSPQLCDPGQVTLPLWSLLSSNRMALPGFHSRCEGQRPSQRPLPTPSLSHPHPLAHSAPSTLSSLLFFQHVTHNPAPVPLHIQYPLPFPFSRGVAGALIFCDHRFLSEAPSDYPSSKCGLIFSSSFSIFLLILTFFFEKKFFFYYLSLSSP